MSSQGKKQRSSRLELGEELGDAVLATQSFQHDADLGRTVMPPASAARLRLRSAARRNISPSCP